MLTSITIQNFKGIGDPVTIPIRPLTIMFGKNSAGKSTVVQALHYAREVLLHKNPNADRTALGGSSIDLGGFQNILHRRTRVEPDVPSKPIQRSGRQRDGAKLAPKSLERPPKREGDEEPTPIILKIEFEVDELPRYAAFERDRFFIERLMSGSEEESEESEALDLLRMHQGISLEEARAALREKDDEDTSTGAVEIEIRWSRYKRKPVITRYTTWLGGEPAGQIRTTIDEANIFWEVNVNHRFLRAFEELDVVDDPEPQWDSDFLLTYDSSLPTWGETVGVEPEGFLEGYSIGDQTATEMIVAPGEILVELLRNLRYVGPLREVPPRNFQPRSSGDESAWANGLAAWSLLYTEGHTTVSAVSDWMSDDLKTGYALELEVYKEIPLDSELLGFVEDGYLGEEQESEVRTEFINAPTRERLVCIDQATGTKLLPQDIGIGISQLIPVVVASIRSSNRIVAVEQPELHLHPAVQAELGDLFIGAALVDRSQMILETHSEHLILRILRRIRESSEGEHSDPDDILYIEPESLSLVFVQPSSKGGEVIVLPVSSDGDLERDVPGGFFAERAAELF